MGPASHRRALLGDPIEQVDAIVEDRHLEVQKQGEAREGQPDVTRACDQESLTGRQPQPKPRRSPLEIHLDLERSLATLLDARDDSLQLLRLRQPSHRDLDRSAADQAVVPAVIVVEFELQQAGPVRAQHREGLLPHLRLDASTADRAVDSRRVIDEHQRAGRLGRRAPGPHQETRGHRATLPLQGHGLAQQIGERLAHATDSRASGEDGTFCPAEQKQFRSGVQRRGSTG